MRQCMDMDNLHNRLKRVDGQIKAIDRMIEQDVPCEDIIIQINAAKTALHKNWPGCVRRTSESLCEGWN